MECLSQSQPGGSIFGDLEATHRAVAWLRRHDVTASGYPAPETAGPVLPVKTSDLVSTPDLVNTPDLPTISAMADAGDPAAEWYVADTLAEVSPMALFQRAQQGRVISQFRLAMLMDLDVSHRVTGRQMVIARARRGDVGASEYLTHLFRRGYV